jgi:tRNA threonylcarbamoyladenosine biosynthesis protein TsaE
MERILKNKEEMSLFAREIGKSLQGGEFLLLEGELGSGKTIFTQALATELGIRQAVTSPTFTIVATYPVEGRSGLKEFIHVDLYRLTEGDIRADSFLQELLQSPPTTERITVIEWADKLGRIAAPAPLRITFSHGQQENERIVRWS